MKAQSVTVSSQAASTAIPLDRNKNPFNVGFGVVATGTLTYTVQHTFDGTNWFDHPDVAAETTSEDGNYAYPVAQVRLNVTAYTNGSAVLTVIQAG